MKIVLKEWMKDKVATSLLLLYAVLLVCFMIFNAKIIVEISLALSTPTKTLENLLKISIICILQIISIGFAKVFKKRAVFHCFSTLNNQWGDKILDADVEMFTKHSCSSIYTTTEFLWDITGVGRELVEFALNITSMCITIYTLYTVAGYIVIPVMVIYIVSAIAMKSVYNSLKSIDKRLKNEKRKRNQEMENIINGFTEVRSFNMVNYHKDRLHNMNELVYQAGKERTNRVSMVSFIIQISDSLGVIAVIYYMMNQLTNHVISQAAAMSTVMLVLKLSDPLKLILEFIDELSQSLSLASDYEAIINYVNRTSDGGIRLNQFNDKLELNNVSFTYNNSSDVLQNISMSIKKGEKVGICGTSGSGKSTLFKLLNKFYDPTNGSISIDGIDISNITNDSYRRFIGSVHQENTIFPGTIRENVQYGSNGFTEAEFIEACKKAKLYEFVLSLDEGFDTEVGPRGLKLSGGQKQRIALARLFLRNPQIILLDEATSALDNENESLVQEAIDALGDKTVITIAHRLTTIKNCDTIYVMANHRIIEKGNHEELINLGGEYAKMVNASNKSRAH